MLGSGGQNPVYAAAVLIVSFLALFIAFAVFSRPVEVILGGTEGAKAPNSPDVWSLARWAWLAVPIVAVVCLVLWYFAYLHRAEFEREAV
jgi:O-antigen/teichoic acid export membrane protein